MAIPVVVIPAFIGIKIFFYYLGKSNERNESEERVEKLLNEYRVPSEMAAEIMGKLREMRPESTIDDLKTVLKPYFEDIENVISKIPREANGLYNETVDNVADMFTELGKKLKRSKEKESDINTTSSGNQDIVDDMDAMNRMLATGLAVMRVLRNSRKDMPAQK